MKARRKEPACLHHEHAPGAPRAVSLHSGPSLRIADYRCRPLTRETGAEELAAEHSIALIRRGVFSKHVRGERFIADANHAVFFTAGEPYRVSHPVEGGDFCTVFTPDPTLLRDLLAEHDPSSAERPQSPFGRTHWPAAPDAFLRHRLLFRALQAGDVPAMAVEEAAFGVLDAIFGPIAAADGLRPARPGGRADRKHRELVEAAKSIANQRFASRLTLGDMASEIGCSVYHLSRLFTRHAGLPIHRYLTHLRLRAALDIMAESSDDLTRIALACGFADHSHFTGAFRRGFGLTPSECRRRMRPSELRRMSKILQAAPRGLV